MCKMTQKIYCRYLLQFRAKFPGQSLVSAPVQWLKRLSRGSVATDQRCLEALGCCAGFDNLLMA
jgi:hypothetical protein